MINAKRLTINPNQELPGHWSRKINQFYLPGEEIIVYDQGDDGVNIQVVVSVRTDAPFIDSKELSDILWNIIFDHIETLGGDETTIFEDYCS